MIRVIKGDITKINDVGVIVNAANKKLRGGGGVDGAIHRAAGAMLLEECITLKGCPVGEAKITKGYNLPCDYIIHAVGPRWFGGNNGESGLLASCYKRSLEIAVEYQIKSIAFPSISTGAYRYPVNEAARIALGTIKNYLEESPGKFDLIEWVLYDDMTFEAYQDELDRLFKSDDSE